MKLVSALALVATLAATGAQAEMRWTWTCAGDGFSAKGAFTTSDEPDADGFYAITGITGEANGAAITALQPAKTAIPGNEGWPVANLVREREPQLHVGGFGFALADGSFANPFYGERFEPPGYLAVLSDPARKSWREPSVTFKAERAR